MWFSSIKKNYLKGWADLQNNKYFPLKRQPNICSKNKYTKRTSVLLLSLVYLFSKQTLNRTILSLNSCRFVNSLSIANSCFCLSMWKITWLNSQQPEAKGHVEHQRLFSRKKMWRKKTWQSNMKKKKVSVCFFKTWMASNFQHDDRLGLDWAGKYPLTNQSALCAFRQVCSQDVRKTTEIWPSIIQDLNKVVLIQDTFSIF